MKYPIYNRAAYWTLFLVDWLLACFFKKKPPLLTKPQTILLCNTAHIGDVILTTSLLPVLKQAFPDAKIGMLVGSWSRAVLEHHPLIYSVHVIDHWKVSRKKRSKFRRYFQMRRRVLKELRLAQYDLAIDCCFHFPNMAPLLWRAKIPVRIGFESAGFGPLLTHTQTWDPAHNISAAETYFSLLAFLHLAHYKHLLHPILAVQKVIKEDFIVIHMGSGNPQKNWSLSNWKALVKWLIDEGENIHFTGLGARENQEIDEVMLDLPRTANLCDKLSWAEFVSTIQKARMLLGVDTSAGHVAAAVDTPAVLLYAGIHPQKVWSPYRGKTLILTHPVPCSPCFQGCQSMNCLRPITVEEVYTAVRSIKPRPTFPVSMASINELISASGTS